MCHQHQGGAVLVAQPEQHVVDPLAGVRVQVAGGFVGKQHLRGVGEGAGDGDPLLLAAGELVRVVLGALFQPNALQEFARPLLGVVPRRPELDRQ